MNRSALAALVCPVVAFVLSTSAFASIACRGGPEIDDVETTIGGDTTRKAASSGEACEKSLVTIDDSAAETAAAGGPACANDGECTVRLGGDYCACPSTPRAMSKSRAAAFDESLKGATSKCTCEIAPCAPMAPAAAVCREGRCVVEGTN
jgi:hypothetical protein